MKPVGISKVLAVSAGLAALLLSSSAFAAPGKAIVRFVQGSAHFAEEGTDWKPLRIGKVLGPGDSVRTGTSSYVSLNLGENGPLLRVFPESTVSLDRLEIDRTGVDTVIETQLDLKSGTIQGVVKKLAAASKYEVKTPHVVAGIRGTLYQISADGATHVRDGSLMVVFVNPANQQVSTYVVNPGETFDPSIPGVRPTRPGEWRDDFPPDEFPGEPIIVALPEPFISPTIGASLIGR